MSGTPTLVLQLDSAGRVAQVVLLSESDVEENFLRRWIAENVRPEALARLEEPIGHE